MPRVCARLAVLALLVLAGCRTSLSVDKQFENPPDGTFIEVDPIKSAQTIKVTATADAPVGVYVFLKKDRDAAEAEALAKKYTGITIAKEEKGENIALQATIPANEAAIVMVSNATAKRANVKLKIKN
jgi:hypothetical protein